MIVAHPITAALSARQVLFSNHYDLLTTHARTHDRSLARSLARKALLYLVGAVNCLFCQMSARSRSIRPWFGLAQLLSLPLLYAPRATERRTRRAGEGWAEQSAAKGIRRPQGAEGRSLSFSTSPRGSSQVWERRESLSLN